MTQITLQVKTFTVPTSALPSSDIQVAKFPCASLEMDPPPTYLPLFLRADWFPHPIEALSKTNVSPDLRIFSMVKKKLNNDATLHSLVVAFCISSGFCMEIKLLTKRKYCSKKWNRYVYGNKQMN